MISMFPQQESGLRSPDRRGSIDDPLLRQSCVVDRRSTSSPESFALSQPSCWPMPSPFMGISTGKRLLCTAMRYCSPAKATSVNVLQAGQPGVELCPDASGPCVNRRGGPVVGSEAQVVRLQTVSGWTSPCLAESTYRWSQVAWAEAFPAQLRDVEIAGGRGTLQLLRRATDQANGDGRAHGTGLVISAGATARNAPATNASRTIRPTALTNGCSGCGLHGGRRVTQGCSWLA